LDAGNVISGIVISNAGQLQVETSAGLFELDCREALVSGRDGVVPVSERDVHAHSVGEKVNLLVQRQGVRQVAAGKVSGVVVDVIFRQDGFKVTLENGLDFYLSRAPHVGEKIYLTIPTTGIKCLA
jgi:hypothetical protein